METRSYGRYTVLNLTGRLVADTVVAAEARILTTIVLAEPPLSLVLDLSKLDAVDSHGAHLLNKAQFAVRAARGSLHLIAPAEGPARGALSRYLLGSTVERREDLTPLTG
ncbi:STAS domain-containing protein [Actinomadura litoris]|uniref:STAS domain-containing protein n=1 Tax=Actinomadura litoris TaxID=2678616 RepID=UPI001FA815BB|nr:STAS domain-containing protein [Actinomadura litoris]